MNEVTISEDYFLALVAAAKSEQDLIKSILTSLFKKTKCDYIKTAELAGKYGIKAWVSYFGGINYNISSNKNCYCFYGRDVKLLKK